MSFGKMNGFLTILQKVYKTDDEGFRKEAEDVVVQVRCYREGRHGSYRWANLAAFSEATDLFRFRCVPHFHFNTDYILVYNGERFMPLSVEDVKGRGMYVEVLAKKVVSTSG